jgi:hypothetical protein
MHGPEQLDWPGIRFYVGQPVAVVVGRDHIWRVMPLIASGKLRTAPTQEGDRHDRDPFVDEPLGIKGVGGADSRRPAVMANAVLDALSSFGVRHIDTPLTSEIWHAMHAAHVD